MKSRSSRRGPTLGLALVLAVIGIRTLIYRDRAWFIEATLYCAIFCVLFRHRGFYLAFRRTPLGYRVLGGALIMAALVGQLANAPERTYPFVTWDLYSNLSFHQPTYLHFMARMEDGSEMTLPITNLPPPRTRVDRRLNQLVVQSRGDAPRGARPAAAPPESPVARDALPRVRTWQAPNPGGGSV